MSVRNQRHAVAVLAQMQAGAALHLQHTVQGPCWTLTGGRPVADAVAREVIKSSSVVGAGDALFESASSQTFLWWRAGDAEISR
jgi:hypothetical protein